ncbi:hypothetical protein OOK36_27945 [Streptomyces sp. NBC_00365]|uniref:hypothetical protein n=1 Tax=Streptomyces sp. NBC_00365 TaxID=2975726 RepID=UPI002250F870|nr:hypothetical protein [Streptomyces sp. NBC_00365]MCX5092645.1 hypothetical protein [Streptomyces sp. NBC_00365]
MVGKPGQLLGHAGHATCVQEGRAGLHPPSARRRSRPQQPSLRVIANERRPPSSWKGVGLVVIKELLGRAHIGVTATVYAHVRLSLQHDAIDLLGHALRNPVEITGKPDDGDEPPFCAAPVR